MIKKGAPQPISTISAAVASYPSSSSSYDTPTVCRLFCMLPFNNHKPQLLEKGAALAMSTPEVPDHRVPTRSSAVAGTRPAGELERVFNYFDENGDGKISPAELQNCLRAAGEEISREDAEAVVSSTDSDGDGLLGMEDFAKLVGEEGEEEMGRNLKDAFRMYAADDQGYITPSSLRRMLKRLGESRTTKECERMIQRFDLNGDGVLSFDEFKVMML